MTRYQSTCRFPFPGRVFTVPALILVALLTGCGKADLTEAEYMQRAKNYQDQGDLRASVIELKNILTKNPNNPEARWLLGKIYVALESGAAAEKELVRARELGVDPMATAVPLGRALLLQGKAQQVLDEIKVTESAPAAVRVGVLTLRGEANLDLGQTQTAQTDLSAALETCANSKCSDTLLALAKLAQRSSDTAKAREWIMKAAAQDPKNASIWRNLGDLEKSQNHRKEALEAYNKAVQADPRSFLPLFERASLRLDMGQADASKADLEAMRKLSPKHPGISYIEGRQAITRKEYPQAQALLESFLKANPGHPIAAYYLAVAHAAQGHLRQAEEVLSPLANAYADATQTRKLLAQVRAGMGEYDNAIKAIEPVLQRNGDDVEAMQLLGRLYLRKGELQKGVDYLQRAAQLEPDSVSAHLELGQALQAQGKSDQALTQFDAALALKPDSSEAEILRVLTHLRERNYDAALADLASFKSKQPKSPVPHNLAASAYIGKNDLAQARKSLEQALSLDPKYLPARVNLARLSLAQNDPAAARNQYQIILKQEPNHLDSLLAIAALDDAAGKRKEATQRLESAIKAHPKVDAPYISLARLYLNSGDALKALSVSKDALTSNPRSPALLEVLGIAQLGAGEASSALATFKKLVEMAPTAASAHQHLATAWAATGNARELRKSLEESLRLQPKQIPAKAALARLDMQQGRPQQALQLAGEIRRDFPKHPEADVLEAEVYVVQKKFPQAWAAYEQALQKGASAQILRDFAFIRDLSGDKEGAQKITLDWLAKHPEDAVTRASLGQSYLRHNEIDKARQTFEIALKQRPNQPDTLNNLAWIYSQSPGNEKRALEYAESAHRLKPGDPLIADTLGWLVLNKGDTRRAVDLLEDAHRLAPANGTVVYHYAYALVRNGSKQQAKTLLTGMLNKNAVFPEKNQANSLLSNIK